MLKAPLKTNHLKLRISVRVNVYSIHLHVVKFVSNLMLYIPGIPITVNKRHTDIHLAKTALFANSETGTGYHSRAPEFIPILVRLVFLSLSFSVWCFLDHWWSFFC